MIHGCTVSYRQSRRVTVKSTIRFDSHIELDFVKRRCLLVFDRDSWRSCLSPALRARAMHESRGLVVTRMTRRIAGCDWVPDTFPCRS